MSKYKNKNCESCGKNMGLSHSAKKYCTTCANAKIAESKVKWAARLKGKFVPRVYESNEPTIQEHLQTVHSKRYPQGFKTIMDNYTDRHKNDYQQMVALAAGK